MYHINRTIMKKGLMMLILMLAVGMTYGQMRSELKGPKAKNYKPWKANKSNTVVVASLESESFKGPEAKNARVWDKTNRVNSTTAVVSSDRATLKGPKAKNRKPWESKTRNQLGNLVKKSKDSEPMAKD